MVDDHAVVAEALELSLSMYGYEVITVPVAAPQTSRDLLTAVVGAAADVVLLDLDLGASGDATRVIHPLSKAGQRVVVLTGASDPIRWGACLARGAVTVLPKTTALTGIVDVIERVMQGLPAIGRGQRDELVQRWLAQGRHNDERRERLGRLTQREAHVLRELARGKRVRQVAEEAFVAEGTVRTHVKSILAKLDVTSQLAAVAVARDAGWASPPSDVS